QELSDLMKLCHRKCDDLSKDHKEVLEYMMMGYVSNIIIAEELGLSSNTVKGLKQTIRRRIEDIGNAFKNTNTEQ
ncbi:MAG: LuxR C-terminal-related transcriptional regulator, partial [Bacteroidota bacterium]